MRKYLTHASKFHHSFIASVSATKVCHESFLSSRSEMTENIFTCKVSNPILFSFHMIISDTLNLDDAVFEQTNL